MSNHRGLATPRIDQGEESSEKEMKTVRSSASPSTSSRAPHAAIMRARNVPTDIGTKRRASCSSQSRMTA
jgi:hypothetical protein